MIKRWLLPLSLLVLLLGSYWFLEQLAVDTAKQEGGVREEEPDYSIDNFTTTAMDKAGRPRYRLEAERMVHYPFIDTSELKKPYLMFFGDETYGRGKPEKALLDREKLLSVDPAWHVKSEQGRILEQGKIILLLGKVHLWKNNDAGAMELDIHTRDLRILPDLNYGETDEAIIIRTATSETRSVGMRTHIRPGRIELLSLVETTYEKALHR
uniref:Lipopolysaccharide export system protein LptC n=1 Tax=Candidatus Kentrum sp. FW TaxID=2126338 RepID=A0A450TSD1_9GAMM|nr:MAG: lipopolysaccharide export system protein LptC [Candidatus Kentron sp. FW]